MFDVRTLYGSQECKSFCGSYNTSSRVYTSTFIPCAWRLSTQLGSFLQECQFPLQIPPHCRSVVNGRRGHRLAVLASNKRPRGFGKVVEKKEKQKKSSPAQLIGEYEGEGGGEEDEDGQDDVVPEVVTNRMLKRITFTVGIPAVVGIAFFPLFYYLKIVKKVDVPEWLPLLMSLLTFGTAGAGITYGLLSASWDPSREGSALGWTEAQRNWPVFLETLRRGKGDSKLK